MLKPLAGYVIVQHVQIDPSATIIAPDAYSGTFRRTMLPGTEDLKHLDAGAPRANVGLVLATADNDKSLDGVVAGGYVLYEQHSSHPGMSFKNAQHLAERFDLGHGAVAFVIPTKALLVALPAMPAPGMFA
jgi:hypothetical protein